MEMRRRTAIGAAGLAGLMLAGCGSSDGGGQDGPVTLAYWDFIDPNQGNPRADALKENIAAFEEANPNIKIELSVVPLGDMLSRLPQSAAAGQAPDVFKMFTPQVPQMAAAGAYEPLPEAALSVTDWLRPTDSLSGPDGKQVAVPYEYRTCVLYYNQKIFDEIGATVPTTYEELVDVAAMAAEAGYTGFGTGFSDSDNSAIISTFFDCFMSQSDQPIWNGDGDADYANAAAEEFGNLLAALRDAKAFGGSVVSDTYSTVADGLANGTVAMSILGTERIVTYGETNPDIKWASLPTPSAGDDVGSTFGWTMGIGAGSSNVDAAWKFIEYMTGPEAAPKLASGGEVPTREGSYSDEYFSSDEAKIVNSIADYVASNSEPHPYGDNWISVAGGLSYAGQSLSLNNLSGREFMDLAQETANN